MTDWQMSAAELDQQAHAMELSQIIAHLASANKQLAMAHSASLAKIDSLQAQLQEKKNTPWCLASDEEEIEDDRRKLEIRLSRLENLLSDRCNTCSSRQRNPFRQEKENKLRCRLDKLESSLNLHQTNNINVTTNDINEMTLSRVTVPEVVLEENCKGLTENVNEAESIYRASSPNNHFRINEDKVREIQRPLYKEEISSEKTELLAEIDECQKNNQRLLTDLDDQMRTAQQLRKDCQASQVNCEQAQRDLMERNRLYDLLVAELDHLHLQKDTVCAKVCSLQQDLQKSLLEKEDALAELQRLKEIIKTEKRNNDEIEETDSTGNANDPQQAKSMTDRAANMEIFRKELILKREARQRAIAAVSSEMERLRQDLEAEKESHSETARKLELFERIVSNGQSSRTINSNEEGNIKANNRFEAEILASTLKVSDELRNDIRLQIEKVDDFRYQLESEPEQHRYQIHCLTEINNRAREALGTREKQTNKLKDYLAQILVRLGDRNHLENKEDLGFECDRQLEHINTLKSLYNERLKVLSELKESASKELVDVKDKLEYSLKKSESLEEDLKKAEEKIDIQDTEISNLESQLGLTKADCRDLQNQMSLINSLFTQMLLGASSADMNLDRLTQLLQENHELISKIAREEGTEAAALPKLLLDLIEQVEGKKDEQKQKLGCQGTMETAVESERKDDDLHEENIAHNLPKVWRVLLELLSCHAVDSPAVSVAATSDPNSCYKSVDTPAGPRLVISVSKTYIRLKELILEKKHLEKEMTRMKQLNSHLESKLGEQEQRLSMVSVELSKTWNIVGRMQAQHQQLHTHEKILRYELQQKRKMLQELKQELEYCREKWESARQKNTNTEIEWRSLRREFAARKILAAHDSFNQSGESGFSDERGDDSDEEDEADDEIIRHGPRRRSKKESPRASTSDTESEQPTDTEISEPKTKFPTNLEGRTSTPETDTELEEMEAVKNENKTIFKESTNKQLQQDLNPLDQALTNVIQNLIGINETAEPNNSPGQSDNSLTGLHFDDCGPENLIDKGNSDFQEAISTQEKQKIEEKSRPVDEENLFTINTVPSVFSIGPFLQTKTNTDKALAPSLPCFSNPVFDVTPSNNDKEKAIEVQCTTLDSSSPKTNEKTDEAKEVIESLPSTSWQVSQGVKTNRTPEEVLASRANRLKRLEEQADWLMKKMNATSRRGSALSSRLEELHQVYKEPPAPPPMPDVLPNCRLHTSSNDLSEGTSLSNITASKPTTDVDEAPSDNVP